MASISLSLVDKITVVETAAALRAFLQKLKDEAAQRPLRLAFVNAHAVNMCHRSDAFFKDLLDCDYLLRDGSGMKILYKMLGRPAGLNLNGTDLIPRILDLYTGYPLTLMGTASPYLERAGDAIAARGGLIAGAIDGFQPDEAYPILADQSKPDLIILAMGMPRQEKIAALLTRTLNRPALIVCGGAILDFMGGKVTRAPQFFRNVGMEWLYRLLIEPKRLFARYVLGNGIFLGRACLLCLTSSKR